jgi:hypothetical protein
VLQGFVGFIVGVVLTVVFLAYQPQLIGDVQQGMSDLGQGTQRLTDRADDNDVALSLSHRFAPDQADERGDDSTDEPDRYADRRDDGADDGNAYGDPQDQRSYDDTMHAPDDGRDDRGRFADVEGASCRGSIALENRSEHSVEIHLHGQDGRALTTDNGDETVDLRPGEHSERDVRAQGNCDHLNAPGALTVEAEICPLNDGQRAGTCHTEDLPVDNGPSHAAQGEPIPERQASAPRG